MAKKLATKPLTAAQRKRTMTLLERHNVAQVALNEWVEYLQTEHDAAGWRLAPDLTAFVREEGNDGSDD